MNESKKQEKNSSQTKDDLSNLHKILRNKLDDAYKIDPPPQELISRLKKLLILKKEVDERTIKQELLNDLNSETRKLLNDVDEYKKRIESIDFFKFLLPKINVNLEIPEVTKDHFEMNQYQNLPQNADTYLKLEEKLKELKCLKNDKQIGDMIKNDLMPYKTLLRRNTKLILWKSLLKKIKSQNFNDLPKNLLDDVDILSYELYFKLKSIFVAQSDQNENLIRIVTSNIFEYYGLFRQKLFEDNIFFNNYEDVQNVCKSVSDRHDKLNRCQNNEQIHNSFYFLFLVFFALPKFFSKLQIHV